MIANLPLFHRIAGHPVIVLGEGEAAEAKRRLVERAGGQVIDDMQQGIDRCARLAFIAYADDASAQADAIRLRCAGLLVNVVDRPELCDFTVPSLLDRAPVLIAIGTGGASAGLAKALRLRLERMLPGTLGALADGLYAARAALRARWPDAGDRRRAIDDALGEGGPLDVLDGHSVQRVETWLSGATDPSASDPSASDPSASDPSRSDVFEVHLRSADPEDLTLREARMLGSADWLAHEPGAPAAILDRARADAARLLLAIGEPAPMRAGLTIVLRATR